jgi:hypothetical protein
MVRSRILRTTGLILLTAGAVAAVGALIVRDQIARHRRDLFSSRALQRFAALGYIGGLRASVEHVQLLRDFVAWEPRTILRRRAKHILGRMEHQLRHGNGAEARAEFAG